MSAKGNAWKVIDRKTVGDDVIELRYAAFGKGKARCEFWKIYRNDVQVGYGANEDDAMVNYNRVLSGYDRNPETGNYERAES